jgi:hypothetical protein
VAQLQSLLREREEELWTPMAIGDQLVTLHLLHRLGIQTRLSVDDIMAELRWLWGVGDQDALLLDVAFMYAVTHIFYVGSGYFQERLDPERYPNEIALFDRALESYARSFPENANFVDISGEILASRRLLGLPETGASRALIRELLRRQKPDGSWLVPRGFQDVHATASVVHGVIDWPAEFRRLTPPGDAG